MEKLPRKMTEFSLLAHVSSYIPTPYIFHWDIGSHYVVKMGWGLHLNRNKSQVS